MVEIQYQGLQKVGAIYMTKKDNVWAFVFGSRAGLGTFGPWVNCPYTPITPTIHEPTISRFPCLHRVYTVHFLPLQGSQRSFTKITEYVYFNLK